MWLELWLWLWRASLLALGCAAAPVNTTITKAEGGKTITDSIDTTTVTLTAGLAPRWAAQQPQ
ncbi:hypothetical protein B5P22_28980 [Pseudomonas tolaasii]|nr:hypothetical protein B5P22_28980 [Pseudomonas tolaasii]